jgi:hypothetical protein
MRPERSVHVAPSVNPFTPADVAAVLRERGWLRHESDSLAEWLIQAAALLGPHAADRDGLVNLLALVFEYNASDVLASRECQEALAREGARDVLRVLASEILAGGPVDSNRLKEIVAALKAKLPYSSRDIFLTLRVALTGRVGGGALDRVVLLLDRAAKIEGLSPVKSVCVRILEFCAALD